MDAFKEDDENEEEDDNSFILKGDILVERESDLVDFTKDPSFNDFPEGWIRTSKDRWKK